MKAIALQGQYTLVDLSHIILQGVQEANNGKGEILNDPAIAQTVLRAAVAPHEHEVFAAAFLDSRHRAISIQILFTGTLDGASVYPREVVKAALANNAAAVIFAHNHPSGVAEPSQADIRITRRLRDALELVDIRVLDHIVVGGTECVSLAERGLC
jgi:DNA repair protein RadC